LTDRFTRAEASERLHDIYPEALHIHHLRSGCGKDNDISISTLFSERTETRQTSTFVVHQADTFDLFTLNKILSHTSKNTSIVFAGLQHGLSLACAPFAMLLHDAKIPKISLDIWDESRNASVSSSIRLIRPDPTSINVMSVAEDAVIDEAIAQYRATSNVGTTVILTQSAPLRLEINRRLIDKRLDGCVTSNLKNDRILRIGEHTEATLGSPLTWRNQDLLLRRFPGDIGTLTEIFNTPRSRFFGLTPVATYGVATFDDVGEIHLCQADIEELTVSYCLNLQTAVRGAWDTVIVLRSRGSTPTPQWLRVASSLARKTIILLNIPMLSETNSTNTLNHGNFTHDAALTSILTSTGET
jgi:hypothetical protein